MTCDYFRYSCLNIYILEVLVLVFEDMSHFEIILLIFSLCFVLFRFVSFRIILN